MFLRHFTHSHSMASIALSGRNMQKLPVRDQIFRQVHRKQISSRQSLKEKLMAPIGPNAFGFGVGSLIGGSALGLGALCFYGLGMNKVEPTVVIHSMIWPQYVRERIHDTYAYFGGSVIVTAVSAAAVFRSPIMLQLFSQTGWMSLIATMALMVGSGMIAQSIPYEPGFGTKQLAWITHCAIMGATLAPLSFIGGPILIRAAWYTAGVVGGLSVIAVCAPSDRFLHLGGPLAIGLGIVFASSVGTLFLPPITKLGAGLYSMSLYGGLLLFSAFLLYDTQRIVHNAENHSPDAMKKFDPINEAISVYLDTINIFIRIVSILAGQGQGQGSRRRK